MALTKAPALVELGAAVSKLIKDTPELKAKIEQLIRDNQSSAPTAITIDADGLVISLTVWR
jgi:hypothetical protein